MDLKGLREPRGLLVSKDQQDQQVYRVYQGLMVVQAQQAPRDRLGRQVSLG
ncbi:hypothetical protein J40TS1_53670 [Paenibacillus montaniterrae]|uniref:Uncharacterized protein n=1 Tax=Paenibacillus montaniterrae TaxID=429341 RepID=A0A919YU39_9BACL|nr:hypothetical protein J40TS1_53670 [Paenibacillus montaniterrae]